MGKIEVILGDITTCEVDAIVNAANRTLLGGGGVDGAIHRAAGPGLLEECRGLGGCETGQAKITGGHRLDARHVIHTVGPVYQDGSQGEDSLLASCYRACLQLVRKHHLRSVAFPAISCGVYGYPIERAAAIAVATICGEIREDDELERVLLVCFSEEDAEVFRRALESARG